jgi:hypothetical protein
MYTILSRTLRLVDQDGWDVARICWLLENKILKSSDHKVKDLFGSMDRNVFRLIKARQQYSRRRVCTRANCPRREHTLINTELCIRHVNQRRMTGFDIDSLVERVKRASPILKLKLLVCAQQ